MSEESLNYCANSGLISELIGELTGEDVLVRYVGEFAKEISSIAKTLINIFVCVSCKTLFRKTPCLPLKLVWVLNALYLNLRTSWSDNYHVWLQ